MVLNNITGIEGIDGSSIIDLTILTEEYNYVKSFAHTNSMTSESIPANYDRTKNYIITFCSYSSGSGSAPAFNLTDSTGKYLLMFSSNAPVVIGYKFKIPSNAKSFFYGYASSSESMNLYVSK